MELRRCQPTFQQTAAQLRVATLIGALRAVDGVVSAGTHAQLRLVVNSYEPELASRDDGESAGRCYSRRPAFCPRRAKALPI